MTWGLHFICKITFVSDRKTHKYIDHKFTKKSRLSVFEKKAKIFQAEVLNDIEKQLQNATLTINWEISTSGECVFAKLIFRL